MTHPTLFKKDAHGNLMTWRVWAEGPDVVTEYGREDGAQQTARVRCEGTNVGQSNERTPEQQAEFEAGALWRKQVARRGYVANRERALRGETDAEGGIPPMLAKGLGDINPKKHLRFPIDAQRKHDGFRVIAIVQDGECSLWSRKQERIECLPHIVKAYEGAFRGVEGKLVFDGEGYRHGWSLQRISSFVRQKKQPREGFEALTHEIYDAPAVPGGWHARRLFLETTVPRIGGPIRLVETLTVGSLDDAWGLHDRWVDEGYEGAILRNLTGPYREGKRSSDLIKLKVFEDHEWEIVGVKEGVGKLERCAIFTCRMDDGKTFNCTSPGTLEDKRAYWERRAEMIGKLLTVKHKGYTPDGIPFHPVGKAVRDYE